LCGLSTVLRRLKMPDWRAEIEKRLSDLKLEPVREAEITEELCLHLEDRYRELLSGGTGQADAQQIALEELCEGNMLVDDLRCVEHRAERDRGVAAGSGSNRILLDYGVAPTARTRLRIPFGKWLSDVRYAWRSLSVRRGSSLATVLVFALGVGLASAMFALTDPYILRPLPFEDSGRLVVISLKIGSEERDAKIPTIEDWRSRTNLFKGVAAFGQPISMRLRLSDGAVNVSVVRVTEDFFDVLGTPAPHSGAWRVTTDASVLPVILTPAGQRALAGPHKDNGVLLSDTGGTGLRIEGILREELVDSMFAVFHGQIHGVTPYRPAGVVERWWSADGSSWGTRRHSVLARLQPGVSLKNVEKALELALPSGRRAGVSVDRLSDRLIGKLRPLAYGAFGAGILILLVCAGNVANLFIARSAYRAREFATREALGANRADIGRLWLTELTLTAALGVIGGIAIAWVALAFAGQVIPAEYAKLGAPALSLRVFVFAAFSGVLVVVAGLFPAALVGRLVPRALMGQGASVAGSRLKFLRLIFGAIQASLAMVLAVGSAMLVQSYINLQRQDTGYDAGTIVVRTSYPEPQGPMLDGIVQSSVQRLRAIPGVQAVSATTHAVGEGESGGAVLVNGRPIFASLTYVMPGFFDVAGMSMRQGRPLEDRDRGWRAVVVNQSFAKNAWPSGSVLGQVLTRDRHHAEVVGVVGDVLDSSLVRAPKPTVYILQTDSSFSASPSPLGWDWKIIYALRGSGSPERCGESIRRVLAGVNGDAVIQAPTTIGASLADSVRPCSFATIVLVLFCVAGGAVTIAGLAGIVTFVIARRTKEMAIRMALGAERRHIKWLVIREATSAAMIGGTTGMLAGRWLSKWLESLVYGLAAGNWATTLIAAALMLAVMIAAALLPARRVVHLQPTEALRAE
jgi:putative ABC transport system permease protein